MNVKGLLHNYLLGIHVTIVYKEEDIEEKVRTGELAGNVSNRK